MSLLAEIQALDAKLVASRDETAIAAALSIGRKRRNTREIGNGTILEVLGLVAGNALLDVINTVGDFRYVKPLVEQGRLQIGSPLVQATVQSLVGTVLTQAQADALCALGWDAGAPVTAHEVRQVLYDFDGNYVL